MLTDVQEMGCGGCGNDTFRMYWKDGRLLSECTQCKSVSIITVSIPQIYIQMADDSLGCLAVTPK